MLKRLILFIRWLYYSRKLGGYEGRFYLNENLNLSNLDCIYIGNKVGIGKLTCILPIKEYAGIHYTPKIIFGENCAVGIRNSFAAIDRIEIGNNVLFAGYVHITDHSHGYEDVSRPITPQKLISKGPVIIEDDCWLGFGCEILSGVHIGKHCIVGARAVVTKDVPPYSVVAGNPARIIKQYNFDTKQWEKVKR